MDAKFQSFTTIKFWPIRFVFAVTGGLYRKLHCAPRLKRRWFVLAFMHMLVPVPWGVQSSTCWHGSFHRPFRCILSAGSLAAAELYRSRRPNTPPPTNQPIPNLMLPTPCTPMLRYRCGCLKYSASPDLLLTTELLQCRPV